MTEASVGHQCPECIADGRRTVRPTRTAFGGSRAGYAGYVTITIIVINVAVMLIGAAMSGGAALVSGGLFGSVTRLHLLGAVIGPDIRIDPNGFIPAGTQPGEVFTGIDNGAVYRLFTAMFIHYGLLHLALNMFALWVLGRNLEAALGPLRFAALYLISGLGGSVAAYIFQPNAPTAGASGAIYGLFAALVLILRRLGRSTSTVIPIIVINFVFTFAVPGISIAGHLGGFLTGAVLAAGIAYAPKQARMPVQVGVFAATVVALLAVTGYAMLSP
jgi:membrane associated rhomboid family serine protease